MDGVRLVLSDYDRTFTDETLQVAPGLAEAIRRLKGKGVMFSIVSGRKYSFMIDLFRRMDGLVDSFVAENGCIGYARGEKCLICNAIERGPLFSRLEGRGIEYDAGDIVVSVHRRHEAGVDEVLSEFPGLQAIRNVDSLMLLPRGASKGAGARWLMDVYCLSPRNMACIGDAENDVEMRAFCSLMGAVSNALPAVKSESDYVCRGSFGSGLREFLEHIEANCS